MRIDASQAGNDIKAMTAATQTGQPAELSEGQELDVTVLLNEKGNVNLKTSDGQVIRARLESEVPLPVGSRVRVVVTEISEGVIYMALDPESGAQMGAARPPGLADLFADRTAAALAARLQALNMPVTEETVEAMRMLLENEPSMPAQKAAFLASNGITADSAMLGAAGALFNGENTAAMLESLSAALEFPAAGEPSVTAEPPVNIQPQENSEYAQGGEIFIPSSEQGAVLDMISGMGFPIGGFDLDPTIAMEAELLEDANASAELSEFLGREKVDAEPQEIRTQRVLVSALTRMPEFENVPVKDLTEFVGVLFETAGELAGVSGEDRGEKLKSFIDGLFLKLSDEGAVSGEKIKRARDELETRLTLFKEAVDGSNVAGKAQVIEQTQKLIDHVRLLGSIEQFVYMQLPVELNGQRKTTELYIYKNKKGGGKIDPDNVKILLALDLEHLGHIESFIGIRGKEVTLQVEVADDSVGAFFKEHTVKLHRMLSEAGYKLADTRVAVSKEDTTVETALLTFLDHEKSIAHGIDFVI